MGRKAKYQRQECVEKALRLFWSKGFAGTSTRELGECLDLKPGSIYAAFGSKEKLYAEVLQQYALNSREQFEECFRGAKTFIDGLRAFFSRTVNGEEGLCSCFLAKTLATGAPELRSIREQAAGMSSEFEMTIACAIARYHPVIPATQRHRVARFVQVQLMGLRSYAEAVSGEDLRKAAIEDALLAVETVLAS